MTVYVPHITPEAVVFAADGQVLSSWGADLAGTDRPAAMLVGVHRHPDETVRLHEYSPAFDPDRFAAHEAFLLQNVRSWVATRWRVAIPAERTAVLGVSASAELALAMGLRHPEVFGSMLCASPGAGYRPPEVMPAHLSGGWDPGTVLPRQRDPVGGALENAGGSVAMKERAGSHGGIFWRHEFPLMIGWAFAE